MQKLISLQADKYTMMKYTSADCREHKDLRKEEREGQGALTRSRCAADENSGDYKGSDWWPARHHAGNELVLVPRR
jgi:hypothetical protein